MLHRPRESSLGQDPTTVTVPRIPAEV